MVKSSPPPLAKAWSTAKNPILDAALAAAMITPCLSNATSSTHSSSDSSSNSSNSVVVALRWWTCIHEATQCLRDRATQRGRSPYRSVEETEYAIRYLALLEQELQPLEADWDHSPTIDPPRFVPYQQMPKQHYKQKKKKDKRRKNRKSPLASVVRGGSPISVVSTWTQDPDPSSVESTWTQDFGSFHHYSTTNYNRFANLEDSDNDDDKVYQEDLSVVSRWNFSGRMEAPVFQDDLEEAGDVPILNRVAHFPTGTGMVMRRIMIRIATAQSELFSYQTRGYRRCQSWALGSENCHASLDKILFALKLANSEISRCLADEGVLRRELQGLVEDANIVEVAVKSLTDERDSFVRRALAKHHQLMQQLAQNSIDRQAARLRMGEEMWCNNSKGKSQVAIEREQQERESLDVGSALDHLVQLDTRSVIHSAGQLKLRLQPSGNKYPNRNNKDLPTSDLSGRVDRNKYPDPALFGWQFTGRCCEKEDQVEVFEKQGMILDWHYATAKVELSWKHASGLGKTTFFQSDGPILPAFYRELVQSAKAWEVVNPKNDRNTTRSAANRSMMFH